MSVVTFFCASIIMIKYNKIYNNKLLKIIKCILIISSILVATINIKYPVESGLYFEIIDMPLSIGGEGVIGPIRPLFPEYWNILVIFEIIFGVIFILSLIREIINYFTNWK